MRGRSDARRRRFTAKEFQAFFFAIFAASRFNLH